MYHPSINHSRGHGVALCPPLFHEYYRSHFSLKRVASELARKGYDVLRFDYSGTGDSKGSVPTEPFDIWSREIGEVIAELRRLGGYSRITIVAVRFSAALAVPWEKNLDGLVHWDPVFDHRRYLELLDATNNASLAEHLWMSDGIRRKFSESDFLGTGLPRATIARNLLQFSNQLENGPHCRSSDGAIVVQSEVDWVCAGLEMIYAHDVIKRIVDAM